ncbi:FGFR1 oncogene partner (FOP) N-terminal dimerization domain [Trinorchestia longiramus]|nr:FGFR1 oncogene partner (FOP) N-terminal dimerization domain [Trinorchestia longiramus]
MSHSVEEDDNGLKDLVSRTLSENGALGKIQAQLRASVFLALEDEFREKDVPLCNPRTKELLQTPAGSLAASLVHEFFTCLGLDFSLAVYGPESNLGAKLWDLHTRECLLTAMGLGEDDEPMTPLLLRLCTRPPAAAGTHPPAAAGTHPPAAAGTHPPATAGTHPPAAAGTHPPAAAGTLPPAAAGTHPPAAAGTHPPAAAGTLPPAAAGTHPPAAAGTLPPAAAGTLPPAAAGILPPQTKNKPLPGIEKRPPNAPSNANQNSKSGSSGIVTNDTNVVESRNSQSVNNNKILNTLSTNGPGTSMNFSTTPKNNANIVNNGTVNNSRGKASTTNNVDASKGNSEKVNTSSKESSTSQNQHQSTKPTLSRRLSPPDDILSAAPPDTDSSEASSSAGDVAELLQGCQHTRLGIKNGVADGKEEHTLKKTLSDGDYEEDFSENSSQSMSSGTNDEESSTSSWDHPPLPAGKSNTGNVLKKDISGAKASSIESMDNGKEVSNNFKNVEAISKDSSAPRRKSMDLLDDDLSIGEFVSSESSSAREETEDIAYNKKYDATLDYLEKF